MIYLDNAATTFKKPDKVIKAVNDCIKKYCGNPGRSSHRLSVKTCEKIYEAREIIANFLGIDTPESVIFTQNATHALNIAIKTTVTPNSHVLISDLEHNSVFRPIYALNKKCGVSYSVFKTDGDIEKNITELINEDTKCIISTISSNVIGRDISVERLSYIAQKLDLTLIVDASQSIGHKRISLKNSPCSVLCAPGHKALFGIQGVGFAVFTDKKQRETFFEGGSGSDSINPMMPDNLPERFEAGTIPSPSIISLLAGIEFINEVGIDNVEKKIHYLTEICAEAIHSIKNTVLYEYGNGVISFNINGVPAEVIAGELDKHGICTRSGLHCAPLAHKTIGTLDIGTVRVSLSYLNTKREIDKFYKILRSLSFKY